MMFFDLSFQQWAARELHLPINGEDMTSKKLKTSTLAAREAWQKHVDEHWAAIKGGEHYHEGNACAREPSCPKFEGEPAEVAS